MKTRKRKMRTANTDRGAWLALRRSAAAAALLLSFLGLSASAQDKKDYALIYGTVWSADNHAIPGVPIQIQRVGDKKPKWKLLSDRRGEFAQRVPTGDNEYVVIADIKAPKGGRKPQTKVHIYRNERADISLHLTE
jgi:hypothetical protein